MSVSVVVPFVGGCEWRDENWRALRPKWEALGHEVIEGSCDGPWRKALAVHDAIGRAAGDVLIVADADVWCDNIPEALEYLAPRARVEIVVPHKRVHRLTPDATVAARVDGITPRIPLSEPAYRGRLGGGIVILRRHVWHNTPIDPRFVGWGQEDEAWGIALRRTYMSRLVRLNAPLWHFWHPPQLRQSRSSGSPESEALFNRYARDAATVVAEAREEFNVREPR